eukprot:COSAG02_NODE_878_length_16266_cov_8.886559_9_plen_240_part_00
MAGLCGVFAGNLIFNQVRETVDHGTLNGWERGPYFSDIGYLEDPSANLKPSATELQAGATPGFKRQPGSGPASNGSAVGQYRRLESNFLVGNYNVNSNLETDDGSSRYLLYNNYFVYSTAATDFAMNANWNYYVGNVHAYGETILWGWEVGTSSPATNCYVYNSSFYMLGDGGLCWRAGAAAMEDVTIHANYSAEEGASRLKGCPGNGSGISFAPVAEDATITAAAKRALGAYPKPWFA